VGSAYRDEGLALGIGHARQYLLIRSGIEVETYRDVAMERAAARRRIGVPEDAFVVGNVGRLSPPKCPEVMVAAFDLLARQRADARLVLVGDGWQRAELEAEVHRRGLAERVHLLGLRRDVPELLRAFDVFTLSSSREGLPRTVLQAMAAGLPVVCTRAGAVADAVLDGETGWIVEVGDAPGLGERLIRLAQDPDLARRMGERGRARVDEFSARRMVQQLTTLYARLAREARIVD
jgi:Glycosyltransferase